MARLLLIGIVLLGQFAVLEAGLRMFGGTEADPDFASLFMPDDRIGHRLRPDTSIRYSTTEFSTILTINSQGVRDAEPIGPKGPSERRVLILGDSYVFAVQVPFEQTFGERLEARLNDADPARPWRVINGGVQGYGPVEQWLFYRDIASTFDPDVVLIVVSAGNDAVEAFDAKAKFSLGRVPDETPIERSRGKVRQIVRSSIVLQLVRLRAQQLQARVATATPERPLAGYLEPQPDFAAEGLQIATRAFGQIVTHARESGAAVGLILMPARFQTHDEDYRRVSALTKGSGSRLVRHLATERFNAALRPLDQPILDLLPRFTTLDDPKGLHFVRNGHLSDRGHRVVADAIFEFLRTNRLLDAAGP